MEDQTLNPFRAPTTAGQAPRRRQATEPESLSRAQWFRELPICLSLVAIILVAYWGVWNYDFVYFDDPGYVTDNLNVVRGLPLFKDFKGFRTSIYWAFTAFEQSNWHPLSWLSHMLDVQLYGLNAGGHHVTNIIFHVCNTLLLFWLLRRMTGRSWCSAAVAALFAVHPMHVESVVWVAERKDVLSTFLGLLTLLAYVRYAKSPSVSRYIPVFVLLALGLLAKPMLITFPCVCLLLDYWPLGRLKLAGDANSAQRAPAERPAVPRRRAKRNQRLPAAARAVKAPQIKLAAQRSLGEQIVRLVVEKIPLFALSAFSAAITPYAQKHGGSMASTDELSLAFRFENSLQSYLTYITRMFWPGKMSVLYLLDPNHVNHFYTVAAAITMLLITALVIWAAYHGRRYLAVGWFWYVGTLVPVIGIVQVGEQTHADRYTYIPYIGLFIMLAWGIADLISLLPQARTVFRVATGFAMVLVLGTCVGWTKYQLQFWTGVEVHLRHALTITPDNWNMLNNLGVYLWKQAQEQDVKAAKAEAEGDLETAKAYRQKSVALKTDAKAQWNHGITSRPTATDIHSNLGYAYSEANDLDNAERHLTRAVELKPISPRPRNNLGRVLLRRSQECGAKAREAEAKSKTDPTEAAKAKQFRDEAKARLDAAIAQFEKAVELDPTLLEARLNLGEVYQSLNEIDKAEKNLDKAESDLDKAEKHYLAIVNLRSESVKDRETINNFSQACFGLARVAVARQKPDEAIEHLQQALELNPQNVPAMQFLANQRFQRGEFREGERCLWPLLAALPAAQRRGVAEQFGGQFEAAGKHNEAVQAWSFMAWAFATSPDPHILDPEAAMVLAQRVVSMTKRQDPLALDALAAAQAAAGQFKQAAETAQEAINLANSKGNKPLAEAISGRLLSYQQGKPYRCDPKGSDRP
ncbi:MAG: tetratricopeptide repeat protein [Thermoguttaceae bacterium]